MDQDTKVVARVEKHLTVHSLQKQIEEQDAQLQQEIAQRKRVEEKLLKHQEHLDELVEERTAELTASNEQLRQEIAARLQAEAELRVKDSALASSINGIGITDLEGALIYANDSLVRMWGYESADEMLGRSLPEFWEGEGVLETVKALREKDGRHGEDTGKRKDGSLFPVQFATSMIKDEAGNPIYMFGSFFDITGRKKAEEKLQKYHQHLEELVEERTAELKEANEHLQHEIAERVQGEEALRESEERATAILNATTDTVSLLDRDGTVLAMNAVGAERFGKRVDELLGVCVHDLGPPDLAASRRARVEEMVSSGKPVRFEDERDGRTFDNSLYPVFDAQGEVAAIAVYARDITERKKGEEVLRYHAHLLENVSDAVISTDVEFYIQSWNQAAEEIYGWCADEVIGRPIGDVVQPEWPDRQREEVIEQFLADGHWEGETIHRRKNGALVHILGSVVLLKGDEGNPIGMVSANRDITERVQAEEALRESEALLKKVLETLPVGVWIADSDGTILLGNPAGQQIWGGARYVGPEQFAEYKAWWLDTGERITPEEWGVTRATMKGEISLEEEIEIECFDGTHKIILNWAVPIFGPQQEVQGAIAVNQDITDRRRAEEALRASEQLLQSALDALSANIAVLDDTGTIIAVNASWRAFGDENGLAWSDYGVGRNYLAVGDSAEGAQEAARGIRELLSGQRDRFSVEYPCHGPSQERWFIMRATRFESSDGVRVAVSHENISERVRAERQIEQAAAVAERERLARELHDAVTQVLFSASLIADTLPRVWERHPEEAQHGLEELRRLTHGALAEMRTLLLELRPGALSKQELGVLLRQLTDGMMARTRMPVATTVVGDCSLPAEVKIALYRITQEALNNVVKHAQASRATVSLDNEPDRVTLRISDDGRGFDVDAAQPHQMGMKIMHERAQAIGAAIRATSQPGQGTELVVTWTGDGGADD